MMAKAKKPIEPAKYMRLMAAIDAKWEKMYPGMAEKRKRLNK